MVVIMSNKNRSLLNTREEAQRIYYQRKTIKYLEKELNKKNNVIKDLEEYLKNYINLLMDNPDSYEELGKDILKEVLHKLRSLKERK